MCWGIELTRNSDKIGEHLKRLQDLYSHLGLVKSVVVDLREPGSGLVTLLHDARIVVYFGTDYLTAEVVSFRNNAVDQKVDVNLRT